LNGSFGEHFIYLGVIIMGLSGFSVNAQISREYTCHVDGTDDLFKVYPRQQIFASDQFSIYQLIDGLTVLVINNQTQRFNRLSNLNLLPNSTLDPQMLPEPLQYFTGYCVMNGSK